jgi:hypothetical protein
MDLMRKELQRFVAASETMLGYEVKLEELTETERDLIQYYLPAMGEKFPVNRVSASERSVTARISSPSLVSHLNRSVYHLSSLYSVKPNQCQQSGWDRHSRA